MRLGASLRLLDRVADQTLSLTRRRPAWRGTSPGTARGGPMHSAPPLAARGLPPLRVFANSGPQLAAGGCRQWAGVDVNGDRDVASGRVQVDENTGEAR